MRLPLDPCDNNCGADISAPAEIIPSAPAEAIRARVAYAVAFSAELPLFTITPVLDGVKIGGLRCRAILYPGESDDAAPRLWYPVSAVIRREFRGVGLGSELYRAAVCVCPGILTPSESLSTGAARVWASILMEGAGSGVVAVESPWAGDLERRTKSAADGGESEAGGAGPVWVWGIQGGSVAPRGEVVL